MVVENSCPVMGRLLLAVGLCLSPWLQLAWAAAADDRMAPQPESQWCVINPVGPRRGTAIEIEKRYVHIVAAARQADAKVQLSTTPIRQLSGQDALKLLRDQEMLDPKSRLYLVRASAFYVDANYDLKSGLEVYIVPDEKVLAVVNTSLSQPGTNPVNLAIIVETDVEITEVDVICLTAA